MWIFRIHSNPGWCSIGNCLPWDLHSTCYTRTTNLVRDLNFLAPFADDTAVAARDTNHETAVEKLLGALDKKHTWTCRWKIVLNHSKFLLFTHSIWMDNLWASSIFSGFGTEWFLAIPSIKKALDRTTIQQWWSERCSQEYFEKWNLRNFMLLAWKELFHAIISV